MHVLQELLVIFAVAVVVVMALRKIGLPPIAGLIVAGVLLGPGVLGLVGDAQQVEVLAEVGVVLLLFGIGLELSLNRLLRLLRPILLGGGLQVLLSLTVVFAVAYGLDFPLGQAALLGCMLALSSTAIVLRGLESRGEIDAPHGRLTLGILLFQDLCVVPMLLLIPILAGVSGDSASTWLTLAKAAGVLVAVLVLSRFMVPRLLELVARTRQRELFVLTVLVVCLGTALIAAQVGVSLAAGAFLAGLVVAGSDYRHQALSDLIPFREVFTSFFFISVGMLLEPVLLVQSPGPILLLLVAIILGKSLLVFLVGAIMRLPLRVCVLSGVALAQVGEFAFVLAQQARPYGLLQDPLDGQLTSAFILSMFVTPLLLAFAPHIAAGMGHIRVLTRLWGVKTADEVPEELRQSRDHVIIAGYGLAGQSLAAALKNCGIPFVVVDLNPANVRLAAAKDLPAFYGDVTSPEVLHKLGIEHSNEVVLTINDPVAEERAVRAVRRTASDIHLVVRTRYVADVDSLTAAGANMIIPAEREAAISIVRQVLNRHCVAEDQIAALTRSTLEDTSPE